MRQDIVSLFELSCAGDNCKYNKFRVNTYLLAGGNYKLLHVPPDDKNL